MNDIYAVRACLQRTQRLASKSFDRFLCPAQYASAHLVPHRGEVFRCQRTGLGEVNLLVLAGGEDPVGHAAVEVDMRIQRAAKALHDAHRPPAGRSRDGSVRAARLVTWRTTSPIPRAVRS